MGARNHVGLTVLLLLFCIPDFARAQEEPSGWNRFKEDYGIHNSIQLGAEYDTNVFKRFGGSQKDGLARLLFKSTGRLALGEHWRMRWNYQGGGKKYFRRNEQDHLIQYLQLPVTYAITNHIRMILTPEIKFQEESNRIDRDSTPPQDINEDYLSLSGRFAMQFRLPARIFLSPFASYTYFRFEPNVNYSFHRERGGVSISKHLISNFSAGSEYAHQRQQFDGATREDSEHEVSGFVQYANDIVSSLRYTFSKNSSSEPRFAFTNHRITLLLSIPIDFNGDSGKNDYEEPLFALHFLGTFQIKDFPSVFDYTDEGERYLLTGAEDDNFNSLVFKLSIHPLPRTTFELKYTRHSNELSSQQDSFARTLYYGGVRYSF